MFAVLLISNKAAKHLLVLFGYNALATQKQGSSKGPDTKQLRNVFCDRIIRFQPSPNDDEVVMFTKKAKGRNL